MKKMKVIIIALIIGCFSFVGQWRLNAEAAESLDPKGNFKSSVNLGFGYWPTNMSKSYQEKWLKRLKRAKVDILEVCHGDGLAGGSINYGFAKETDWAYIRAVKKAVKHTKLAVLLLPGIGTIEHLRKARKLGVDTVRIATHCTEADISKQHIEEARKLGYDTVGFLMMAHATPTKNLVKQAKLIESYGAHCI